MFKILAKRDSIFELEDLDFSPAFTTFRFYTHTCYSLRKGDGKEECLPCLAHGLA